MLYTMKDLCSVSGTTPQSIHKLFKSNKELKALLAEHTITEGRNKLYTQEVYDWFCRRYSKPLVENGVGGGDFENETAENPNITPAPVEASASVEDEAIAGMRADIEEKELLIASLSAENDNIKRENDNLTVDLAAKEADIAALQEKNGDLTQENIKLSAELEANAGIIEGLRQSNNSLTEANEALQGQITALNERIAAQEKDIDSKTEQIERLIVSNNALSITVNRAQAERLLAQAKKPPLFQRIKNKLFGIKPPIVEETAEAVKDETEAK